MGYFSRKVDRARSRARVRELADRSGAPMAWEGIPLHPPRRICFLRFAVLEMHAGSRKRTGIFHASGRVHRHARGDRELVHDLDLAVEWFNEHLVVPHVADERAVFLFKSTARECMRRAWDVIACLRRAGLVVEMQTVSKPGKILYEDEHQVAVLPWADADLS